ncbi:unnamed protein product, partial [Polarella glacialis]
NVAKCLVACSPGSEVRGPRIVRGASHCLRGENYGQDGDGLGDAGLPEPPAALVPRVGLNGEREAAVEIIALCREASSVGAVVCLVMLGPLTNLALALQQEPKLRAMLPQLVVMGGCGNGHGNYGRATEFNIMADPEAAAKVFTTDWPDLTVASWETSLASFVPWPVFDKLLYSKEGKRSKVGRFLGAVCHWEFVEGREQPAENKVCLPESKKRKRWPEDPLPRLVDQGSSSASSSCGAVICDAVAVAIALKPEVVRKSCDVHVEVELKGDITRGQTVVDWGTSCEGAGRQRRVCWAEELDVEMFCQMLRETVAA